jgi:NAD(P)H dehydrogenase (quinone)
VLEWSGVPTVNVRAAIFVENPILTWLALEPLGNGELRLPFGAQRFAPIAGYDVAELCVKILVNPAPHISKSYELTGPELKDMHEFAEDCAAALGRQVTYVPDDVETWNERYVDSAMAAYPHIAEHLKDLTRLVAGVSEQLETLLGRPPKTVRWALENHPRIQKLAAALSQ